MERRTALRTLPEFAVRGKLGMEKFSKIIDFVQQFFTTKDLT